MLARCHSITNQSYQYTSIQKVFAKYNEYNNLITNLLRPTTMKFFALLVFLLKLFHFIASQGMDPCLAEGEYFEFISLWITAYSNNPFLQMKTAEGGSLCAAVTLVSRRTKRITVFMLMDGFAIIQILNEEKEKLILQLIYRTNA